VPSLQLIEPGGEVAGVGSSRGIERGQIVPADPVDVGSPPEQKLGDLTLVAVAGRPEGLGDFLWSRRDLGIEVTVNRRGSDHAAVRGALGGRDVR